MELEDIQDKLTEAHSLYVERTGQQPILSPQLCIASSGRARCEIYEGADRDGVKSASDTIEGALDAFIENIKALPTGKEKAVRDFQRNLAALIDQGNATGIPVEFVNPLTAMARKLAENAITDQRERA